MLDSTRVREGAILASRLFQLANGLAISLVVVWAYGLASAGTLALASLPGAVASLVIAGGLPSALPRAAANDAERATLGLAVSTLAIIPAALGVWAYSALLGRDHHEAIAIAALGLSGGLTGQVNVQQTLYVLQGRQSAARLALAPLAPFLHLAGTAAAMLAPTLDGFALVLLTTRILGCTIGFLPLAYSRIAPSRCWPAIADAARFTPLDLAGLLGEQLPVVLLSGLLTRAELGAFGLLRQFVTVADTPGWSFVFSRYPELVENTPGAGPGVARSNERLAWASAAGCLVVALTLALFAYRIPLVATALPIVLLPMHARYLNNFVEQALRATGHIADCAALALTKLCLSLALFGTLAWSHGFWGAVAASALLSLGSGLIYRRRLLARFPGVLRPLRPWRLA